MKTDKSNNIIKGGVESDGVYFVIKDEKETATEAEVKKWLQKIKVVREAPKIS